MERGCGLLTPRAALTPSQCVGGELGGAPGRPGLIKLPEVGSTRSLVTRENCVDEKGGAVTMPSIQSPAVSDSGSYSSSVNVPSEFRAMSRLATCPCATQEENVRLRLKAKQLGEKTVEEFARAVTDPPLPWAPVPEGVV